ncbi:lysine transporter LysE [Streptomyces sp. CB03234]|uniref:LysE family translocator n=1 Tax=Streptomyces sp. (strain CB03234) TaxID=1703937 RepID=UPI00093E181D|nr:LysE family translocator [Streptomyces sp. CB03234]OKK04494.1 lysine transporter LysE [Streptomyces sp. CB03234]
MNTEFLLTSLVVVATPGTGALYTIAAGLSRGARASAVAAIGCTLGTLPHMAAAVTGLAALLHTSAPAFQVLKYAGVAYLLFMAWATLRDKDTFTARQDDKAAAAPPSTARVIASGVLVNLLNPKLTVFFFAFLPQFVSAGAPDALPRMAELSAVFMALTLLVFLAYGRFAAALRHRVLTRPRVLSSLRRVFAGAFAAMGARLAFL